MSSMRSMMGGGLPAASALGIGGTIALGLTATGSTSQANSFPVVADVNQFTTTAANTGALLPSNFEVGGSLEIYNNGASTLFVYPHVGGQINGNSANAKIDVATLKGVVVKRLSDVHWGSVVSG